MFLRRIFTILAVILLVEHTVSAPGGKHRTRGSGGSSKPTGKIGRRPPVKGGGKVGVQAPAVQQKKDPGRQSLPLDILPYHYTVSIVPDLDNSTFFGEVMIDFEAESATQEILLHAANLQIDFDKLVLSERRCAPPIPVEVTSASTLALSPSTPEYVGSSSPATTPEAPGAQYQTSGQEAPINPGQTSSEMPPPPPTVEVVPGPQGGAPATEVAVVPATGEAPAALEESLTPPMEEAPAPPMEEAQSPSTGEAPSPPMEEALAPSIEEAPASPMEEVPSPPKEEAPASPLEAAPAPPMEEAPAPGNVETSIGIEEPPATMEKAPAPSMEEPPAPQMAEASVSMEQAVEMAEAQIEMEEAAEAMEEALAPGKLKTPVATEEAPAAIEGATVTMEEAPMPPMEEAPVAMEEAPVVSENVPTMSVTQQGVAMADDAPAVHDNVPATHEETPVMMDEVPSMPEEAPAPGEAPHEEPISHDTPSLPEEAPAENEKAGVVATSTSAAEIMMPTQPTTTFTEPPIETTTEKDTFNLAGEALKILEVLNRSDIPPFFKANLTDDDDMVNFAEDDDIVGHEIDKIDHYMDKLETRADDLATEDCQKIEVIQPPPSNYVPPPLEEEESIEQTTGSVFNNIRTALEQIIQTTLAPLLAEENSPTNEIPTTTSVPVNKTDILRSVDNKSTGGKNSFIKDSVVEISTVGKTDVEVTTGDNPVVEVTTVGKDVKISEEKISEITTVNVEDTTAGKSSIVVTTDGKSEVETTTDDDDQAMLGKSGILFTTEEKSNVESTSERRPDAVFTSTEKMDVEGTTDGKFGKDGERTGTPEIVRTTYTTESSPLQREEVDGQLLTNHETTAVPERTTIEALTMQVRESTNMPTGSPTNLGTEWSIDSLEAATTEDVFSMTTTEKSREATTEYVTTTETRKSRKRRAAPKRKRRPIKRNKLKQSAKLPTCTSEDLYEVRVDKALIPVRRTEVENPDIGVEIDKDKIKQGDHDVLVLPTKTPLKAGKRYRLTMSFSGKMARRPVGLYRSDYVVEEGGRRKSKYVATTVMEPIHARRVFPCFDEPRFRARFSLRIAHPPNLSAYSNMPASTTSDDVDSTSSNGVPPGWLWDRFETSPPMPTYLVAFFVGALARKSRSAAGAPGQNDLMVRVLARRERLRDASFALNLAPKVMMEMGQWLNRPTSLTKLDLLAMPGPGPDAVENWGLVSFQERYLLTQPGLLSRFSVASVLSHELAHDWFGNLVTPHNWKYAWLSEGLATYSSARILSKIQPTWDVEDLSTASAYITALSYSDDNNAIPMQPKRVTTNNYRTVFSPSSYYKGYMMMRMLQGIIGDEMLTGSLRRYVQENAFGWAKSSRLWSAVNETAKEQNITLDLPRTLPKLMASWIEQPGYPLVTITRNYTSGEIYVKQGRYSPARSQSNATWWIPLRTWTAQTTGALLQWLPPSSKDKAVRFLSPVPIGADQWLMANAEFSAPFRVQYDKKNWDLLAAALPDDNLPRGAGAQLSVDALSLASDGLLPFSVALKVISSALESRTGDAHMTWTAVSPVLRRIDRELRGTKASRPYRQWLHRLMTPLDTWISFDARNDTLPDAILARHVTTVACSLAMPLCLSTGRSQFRTWMASNTPEPRIPIELRGTLYCAAVRDGTSDTIWRFLWSKISTAPTDERIRILKGLGCTRDPELAKRLLQLAADVKSPVYKKQLPTIVRSIAMHDSGPGVVLSFLAENIQRFNNDTKTLGRLMSEVAPAINSKKDMKKLQGLLPQLTSSRATVAKVSADATTSMERSQRLSQGIFAYFNKTKKPNTKVTH